MATDYGSDVDGLTDIDPAGRRITGPRVVLIQLARRLMTRKGRLAHAPNEGFDIRDLLSQGLTLTELAYFETQIAQEAERDERIQAAQVTIGVNTAAESLKVTIKVVLAEGTFELVLAVDKVTVAILHAG